MKLFSNPAFSGLQIPSERAGTRSDQPVANQIANQKGASASLRRLNKDTVQFSGKNKKDKYDDLNTTAIIDTPNDLKVTDSRMVGGLRSGGDIFTKEVTVGGEVVAQQGLQFIDSEAGSTIKTVEGDIYAQRSARIGGIHSVKGNVKAYEVAVQGDVTAEQGDVHFLSSNTDGQIHAGRHANVTKSKYINGIHANGNIKTDDILAKGNVVSENGNIDFNDSDVQGTLQTRNGHIRVDDSDLIGGVDSAKSVSLKDVLDVRNTIHAGDDVSLLGKKTKTHDIIIHSGKSETPNTVELGDGVTVDGNIQFENGHGFVVLGKGASLNGETNGEIVHTKDKSRLETLKNKLLAARPGVYGGNQGGPSGALPNYSSLSVNTIPPAFGDESTSKRLNPETGKPE